MLVIHLLSTSVLKGDDASGLIPDRTTCRKVVKIYILSDYKQKELKECCLQKTPVNHHVLKNRNYSFSCLYFTQKYNINATDLCFNVSHLPVLPHTILNFQVFIVFLIRKVFRDQKIVTTMMSELTLH